MDDKTLMDEFLIQIGALRHVLPEHELITFYDIACRTDTPPRETAQAFKRLFDPDGSRSNNEILQAYVRAIEKAVTDYYLAIDLGTVEKVNEQLEAIRVSHSSR